jgi:DNA-binding MarR family transcriptional regulator/ribosomal protein S18 acetylase RimI-like enzyme
MQVGRVRSFNRTVTERVGALQDEYLDRGRALGADRVLWEIGEAGTDLRALRTRLGLDSGYLSRLIGGLQREGLVEIAPGTDKRVRAVSLTAAGRAERELLDRRSDELAQALLEPLSATRRERLVYAMATVERLLTAGLVEIAPEDPESEAGRACLRAYFAELDARFDIGFDPSATLGADDALLLVARLKDEPIGCGAIKLATGDIKRMWVVRSARGLGVGRRILSELERRAKTPTVRLETNRGLTEAIGLYRAAGYVEVASFNAEPYADHWFQKRL